MEEENNSVENPVKYSEKNNVLSVPTILARTVGSVQ